MKFNIGKGFPYGNSFASIIGGLNISGWFNIRAGDSMENRNRMGPAAGPTLILKSWLGLRVVEDWELKLDAGNELQTEEVDRLFREHSTRT